MAVTKYLQLYGILDVSIYQFESMAAEFITDILEGQCKECYLADYNQLGVYLSAVDGNKYFGVIAVKGGYGANQKNYTKNQIEDLVKILIKNRQSKIEENGKENLIN